MKEKWYYGALFVVLALLGIGHGNFTSPNQEILLQYNIKEVTIAQADNTIAVLTKHLQNFGIDNIHVNKASAGELRISYHSAVPIEHLKKALSESEILGLVFDLNHPDKKDTNTPSEENQKSYQLVIYELQNPFGTENSAGKYLVIVKQDYDRFFNSNPFPTLNHFEVTASEFIEKPSTKFEYELSIAKDKTSYSIPEVRAGPVA